MSLTQSDRQKRPASNPLSEGEEADDLSSRRARMKRINLTHLTEDQDLPPVFDEVCEDPKDQTATVGAEEGNTTKAPVTLESLSGKIDQILGYLVTNKNELSAINKRHEGRLHTLEIAHNEVVDKFDQVTADISNNAAQIARNSTNIESNETCIETLKTQLRICKATNEDFINKFKDMDMELKKLKVDTVENKRCILDMGLDVRERRLSLSGVMEKEGEDPIMVALTAVNQILTHALKETNSDRKSTTARPRFRVLKLVDIDNVYRLGKPKRKGSRPLIISFSFSHIRQMVLTAKYYMKNLALKYYLNEDLTQEARDHRANLKVIAEGGKSLGHDTKITGNKIIIDSETYQPDEIGAVSPTIIQAAKRERLLENAIAFRGDRSIFSNFFPSPITIDDVDYTSVEQYFQHEKALQCGDLKQARKIMNKSNPWYIKIAGSRVELNDAWKKNRLKTLYQGIFAKFEQNIPLRQALLNTVGLNLYEATTDLFYACGIDLDSPKWVTGDWPGQNVTGKILMKVRGEFLAEESLSESTSDNTLMNLASDLDIVEVEPDASLHDSLGAAPMETGDQAAEQATGTQDETNQWPTPAQASVSFTDAVKHPAGTPAAGKKPKLNKSIPQVTQTPTKKNSTGQQRQTKNQPLPNKETLSKEDMAFLDISTKRRTSSNKGKGKNRRKHSNSTSTPAKGMSNKAGLSNLSPKQQVAIEYLGFPIESEYVRNIISSQSNRK